MQLRLLLSLLPLVDYVVAYAGCHQDNCLQAFEGKKGGDKAFSFCKTFTKKIVTATTSLPDFVAKCTGNPIARASSACTCFAKTYKPYTTRSSSSACHASSSTCTKSSFKTSKSSKSCTTSKTSFKTSSKLSTKSSTKSTKSSTKTSIKSSTKTSTKASTKTSTSSTKSSTKTSTSSSTSSPTPTCKPNLSLEGVSEKDFNPASTPFSLKISCNKLDAQNYTIFSNTESGTDPFGTLLLGTTATESAIQVPGFEPGKFSITVTALDTTGNAIIQTFSLLFGSITMPVLVLDETGAPVQGLSVTADATIYPGIKQVGITDSNGIVNFQNLFSTTIGLLAKTADNKIGVNGVAGTPSTITLNLIPFRPASTTTSFNISDGITGWTGGVIQDVPITKRDNALVIGTNGASSLQLAHAEPKVYPFTKSVYIKYKFQTSEVPGGFFGTQFNDYYLVTIRSNTGNTISVSHSMNELGLGAFDSAGGTEIFTLNMPVDPKTEWVEYDVAVSNVADALYDSQVIVTTLGDLTCDQCGSCSTCPGDPMCQPTCKEPPLQSCAFYADCAEATLLCGEGGYPLAYGQKNCLAFQRDLNKYTSAGQAFIWSTMHCLQLALIEAINCDSTCDAVGVAAFDSHPKCYVDSGFCDLPLGDWVQVVKTVGSDLLTLKALQQIFQTGGSCAVNKIVEIDAAIDGYVQQAKDDVVNAAVYLAKALAMKILRKFVMDLIDGSD